jgi:hypothetical protein
MDTIMGQITLTLNVGKCFQQSHLTWVPSYTGNRSVIQYTGNFIQYKWGSSVHIVTDGYMASMIGNFVNLFPHVYSLLFTQFRKFNHGRNVFPWTAYATSSPFHHVKWKSFSVHSIEYWNLHPPDVISSPVIQQLISKISFRAVTILYYWGQFLEQAVDGKQPVLIQPSGGSNLPKIELSTC